MFFRDRIRIRNETQKVIRIRFKDNRFRLEPKEQIILGGGRVRYSTQEVEIIEVFDMKKRKSDRVTLRKTNGPQPE